MIEEVIEIYDKVLGENYSRRRILYVAPHLSTGGMPEVLRKRIELLKNDFEIFVVEFTCYGHYDVQRNKIRDLVGEDHFFTLGKLSEPMPQHIMNRMELIDLINQIKPAVVHMEEVPEMFGYNGFPDEVAQLLYKEDRDYVIFETSHDSSFDPNVYKRWFPDRFLFISPWHLKVYKDIDVPQEVIEYPIEIKQRPNREEALGELGLDPSYKHVLNVGLFTPRKNQAEIFDLAKHLIDEKVQFHFVGNQAGNFEFYWKPLIENAPPNCKMWGEQRDVDKFYRAMDLFIFASLGQQGDKETNPIVLKEALGWQMPILMYNLDEYCGSYDDNANVSFLTGHRETDVLEIKRLLEDRMIKDPSADFAVDFREENKIWITYSGKETVTYKVVIYDIDTRLPIYNSSYTFSDSGYSFWLMPVPISFIDFQNLPQFNGFYIEFLNERDELVFAKDVRLRNDPPRTDVRLYADKFDFAFHNFYEFFYKDIYEGKLDGSKIVIDAGASYGSFTAYMLSRGASKVYALEPIPSVAELTSKSFSDKYKDKVTVLNCGLAVETGQQTFYQSYPSTMSMLADVGDTAKECAPTDNFQEITVDTISFSDLLNRYDIKRVSLLKVDIEGYEYKLIDSFTGKDFRAIDKIMIEFHYNKDGGKVVPIIEKLKEHGFDIEFVRGDDKSYDSIMIATNKNAFPKKAFITHSTLQYLPTVESLIKSIHEFSSVPVVLYTINCDCDLDYPNLITIRHDEERATEPKMVTIDGYDNRFVDRDDDGTYFTLTMKPELMMDAISRGLEEGVYLDGDMIANCNVDDLFDYIKDVTTYPLVTEGVFEIMGINGHYDVELPLMQKMGVSDRLWYRQTNTIVFTNNCYDFISEWRSICRDPDIIGDWRLYAPYHEETIINVLFWKYKHTRHLPQSFINTVNVDTIKYMHSDKLEYSELMLGSPVPIHEGIDKFWMRIPKDISQVKVFHGVKSIPIANEIINYLKSRRLKIAILTLSDSNYRGLSSMSRYNFRRYAAHHGYDFIEYNRLLDNEFPAQWNKILALKEHLHQYEWVFWVDSDMLLMDLSQPLEKLIDPDYDLIISGNRHAIDNELTFHPTYKNILDGQFLIRNTSLMHQFLDAILHPAADVPIHDFDHEVRQMRILLNQDEGYRSRVKIIDETSMCSMWYNDDPDIIFNHYPDWNLGSNIYKRGDFVIHFTGYPLDKRIELMEKFSRKVDYSIVTKEYSNTIHSLPAPPMVSIVMAYYNRPQQLISTLQTIAKTAYPYVEIIVVDDGDNNLESIIEFIEGYRFKVKLLSIPKEVKKWVNPCIAYNIGFAHAEGDYILIQNPENAHFGDVISHCANNLTANNYLIYSCCAFNTKESAGQLQTWISSAAYMETSEFYGTMRDTFYNYIPTEERSIFEPGNYWYNHPTYRPMGYHFCVGVHRNNLDVLNGFDERFSRGVGYDDDDLFQRVKNCDMRIDWIGEEQPFVIHLMHDMVHSETPSISSEPKLNHGLLLSLPPERIRAKKTMSDDLIKLGLVEVI